MGKDDTGEIDMIGFRHVAVGWRIRLDPSIFGGIQQITIGHNGVIEVIHDTMGVGRLDPNE